MQNFLGVLGGMGPLATADFLKKLVEHTPASVDQEHIPVMLYSDCTTPDRTAHIVGDGPSPLPQLLAGIHFLNNSGATAICIPCNSAHCWYDEMVAASQVPVFHIVRSSAAQVRKKNPAAKKVGVLSTFGTHRMGIYKTSLLEQSFDVVSSSDEEFTTLVSPSIALIKADKIREAEVLLTQAADMLRSRGAEMVILGCTELPIGLRGQYLAAPQLYVDSTEALVQAVVDYFRTAKA
ncbi:MAG: amino acid racemase [Pseudomonadota bacterium]